jgi:CubicO group peptidase (beta-lactamase class C family)
MIGSITKSFTALAVMQLVEAGKVELDAPVRRYIPWFGVADSTASARITVRHLLTMTGGLPQLYQTQLATDDDPGTIERNVRLLGTEALSRPVGDGFFYSNSNYETLGLLVQMVSGQSYEEYVQQHIFAPLDMRNSFTSQDEAMRHGMAAGHRWWFGIPVAATFPFNRGQLPAGYIIASTEDMAHYLIAQMNDGHYGNSTVLTPAAMALMHVETPPATYGIGWESVRSNRRHLLNSDGGTVNFQSSIFFDPASRVGVYVAANVVNALDTFSSPHGASVLDGSTVRSMAHVILTLATNQPPPDQGPGHERLTLMFNLLLLALTVLIVIVLLRTPRHFRRLAQLAAESKGTLVRHASIAAIAWLIVPIAVAWLALFSAPWKVIAAFQPDLAWWLYAVAVVLLLRALLEIKGLGTRD